MKPSFKKLIFSTILSVFSAGYLLALPLQSDSAEFISVPAPGAVTINGKSDEWDLSGEMYVYPVRNIRDRYSVKVYSMYDKENLYLMLKWRDPSPLVNNVDADGAPGDGWMADSLQMRFVTDQGQVHMTAWYGSKSDKSVLHTAFGGPFTNIKSLTAKGKTLKDTDTGVEMVFLEDADKRGYTQEIKLPWSFLYKDPANAKPGERFTFTGEYYWGGASGTTWPGVQWADPINPEIPQRVVIYQNPNVWGKMFLSPKGNLPVVDKGQTIDKLQGVIPIRVKIPEGSTKFTLVINDKEGNRVRNLASHANVEDYLVSGTKDQIEVMWDGRGNGEWDKQLNVFVGDLVKPGEYTASGIANTGIGVLHAGAFYNPNLPPWPTANSIGGWGYDHSICTGLAAMPSSYEGKGRVFAGWAHGECGVGFIVLDKDGLKIGEWLRRGAGAYHITTGPKYVYFIFGYNNMDVLGRINPEPDANGQLSQVAWGDGKSDIQLSGKPGGIAYVNGQVAVSLKDKNMIVLYDGQSGAETGKIEITAPTLIAGTSDGNIIGVSGDGTEKQLFIADTKSKKSEIIKLPELQKPSAVAIDSKGRLYVGDQTDQSIKMYDKAGKGAKFVRVIGEKGGHRSGKWNDQRMNPPIVLTVEESSDGKTFVWSAEDSTIPKRISVWDPETGKLVKDYVGGTSYAGSGGAMSDNIPDMGLYRTMKLKVDYDNHTYVMDEIMVDGYTAAEPVPEGKTRVNIGDVVASTSYWFGNITHFINEISGKKTEYLIDNSAVAVSRGKDWKLSSILGNVGLANNLKIPVPEGTSPTSVFAWNDSNKDGLVESGEVVWHDYGKANMFYYGWAGGPDKNLVYYHSGYAFKPVKFDEDGAPVYDITKGEKLPGDAGEMTGPMRKTKFGWLGERKSPLSTAKSDAAHGLHEFVGFDQKGILRWEFPNYWLAVHGGFTAPIAIPGNIMGALKISGIFDDGDHSIISVRGNHGQEFLIRDDGVYLTELFTDQRMAPGSLPATRNLKETIGIPINDTTLGGEAFSGWIARQDDGKVRMTYGHVDVRIAEVVGLDTVKPIGPVKIDLTDKLLAQAKSFKPIVAGAAKTTYDIVKGGPITADGKLFDTPEAIVLKNGPEEVGKAIMTYDDKNLYVGWRVFDMSPFMNNGAAFQTAFKTGDSVNLFIAPEGNYPPTKIDGIRVLLAPVAGKNTAVVYKPTGSGKVYTFQSPVRTSQFGYVAEESSIKYVVTPGKNEYIVTAEIPWSVLGITPSVGLKLKGDIGMLFGDQTNSNIGQRVQWVDKGTNVVNDEPTESEFFPGKWGTFELK